MSELSNLFIRNYRAYMVGGQVFAVPEKHGLYRASSAKGIVDALTDGSQTEGVWVRGGKKSKKWTLLPRIHKKIEECQKEKK